MKQIKVALYAVLAALAAFVVLVPIPVICAQSGNVAAAITKLENDGVKADLAGDTKSWTEKYAADDWMGCDSSGKWYTKPEVLKMLADPKNNKYNSEKISDLKVRVYGNGNTAVATYTDAYDAMVDWATPHPHDPDHRRLGENRQRLEGSQLAQHHD